MDKENNAYKVTISGSFISGDEYIDFSNITGYVPANSEEVVRAAIINRYCLMWLKTDKKIKHSLRSIRECYDDEMGPCRHEFSYAGKDIRDMTHEELQDLACAFDLREVPLYKKSSLQETRKVAYAKYSEYVLDKPVDYQKEGFRLPDQPKVIVEADTYQDNGLVRMSEQSLTAVEDGGEKEGVTYEQLVHLAKKMNIKIPQGCAYKKLYEMVYA